MLGIEPGPPERTSVTAEPPVQLFPSSCIVKYRVKGSKEKQIVLFFLLL